MKKQTLVVLAAIVLVAVFATAAMMYRTQQADQFANAAYENASLLERDYSPRKGDPGAKVTIVEFFDPACGTCRSFYPFVEQLMEVPQLGLLITRERHRIVLGSLKAALHVRQIEAVLLEHFGKHPQLRRLGPVVFFRQQMQRCRRRPFAFLKRRQVIAFH